MVGELAPQYGEIAGIIARSRPYAVDSIGEQWRATSTWLSISRFPTL